MSNGIEYPNKIYSLEYDGENGFLGNTHINIIVAASSSEVAREYVKEIKGFDIEPIWLMNAVYPTIWVRDGSVPEEVQAKILTTSSTHYNY